MNPQLRPSTPNRPLMMPKSPTSQPSFVTPTWTVGSSPSVSLQGTRWAISAGRTVGSAAWMRFSTAIALLTAQSSPRGISPPQHSDKIGGSWLDGDATCVLPNVGTVFMAQCEHPHRLVGWQRAQHVDQLLNCVRATYECAHPHLLSLKADL